MGNLEVGEVLDLFGYALLIMIGIELIETIRAFLIELRLGLHFPGSKSGQPGSG